MTGYLQPVYQGWTAGLPLVDVTQQLSLSFVFRNSLRVLSQWSALKNSTGFSATFCIIKCHMQSIAFNLSSFFFFWLLRVINVHDIYYLVSVFLSQKCLKTPLSLELWVLFCLQGIVSMWHTRANHLGKRNVYIKLINLTNRIGRLDSWRELFILFWMCLKKPAEPFIH